jgi:hypothetical protein
VNSEVEPNEELWQAPQVADMDDIEAFQHRPESVGLVTPVAERRLAGAASSQVPEVRLGTEATCIRRCEEAGPDTHELGDQQDQEEDSGMAADHLHTAVVDNTPVPGVGVVAGRASAGDRVLWSPLLAGSGVAVSKVFAVVGIVPVAAYSEADRGAYLGSQEEARRVATSSYQAVEVAPVSEKKKLCSRHWECADY